MEGHFWLLVVVVLVLVLGTTTTTTATVVDFQFEGFNFQPKMMIHIHGIFVLERLNCDLKRVL